MVVAMVSLCVATLATNIAANVVSPANDFAHLWPSVINFRVGGFITGMIGILMQPWRLVADPNRYFEQWLIAYSALLGAVGGVLDPLALRQSEQLPRNHHVHRDERQEQAAEGDPRDRGVHAVDPASTRWTGDEDEQEVQSEHAGAGAEGAEPRQPGHFGRHGGTLTTAAAVG